MTSRIYWLFQKPFVLADATLIAVVVMTMFAGEVVLIGKDVRIKIIWDSQNGKFPIKCGKI